MRATWLIAINFVQQQRIVLLVFVAWLVVFGVLLGILSNNGDNGELVALFRQQAAYGVAFGLLISSSAIHEDRKSRRIVAVLSKGIHRYEYLAGLALGNALLSAIYFALVGCINQYYIGQLALSAQIWPAVFAAWLAAILAACLTLFFGAFLHPMFAASAAAFVAAGPMLLGRFYGEAWYQVLPIGYVLLGITRYNFAAGWTGSWQFAGIVLAESVLFVGLGAAIFSRMDVTTATE